MNSNKSVKKVKSECTDRYYYAGYVDCHGPKIVYDKYLSEEEGRFEVRQKLVNEVNKNLATGDVNILKEEINAIQALSDKIESSKLIIISGIVPMC